MSISPVAFTAYIVGSFAVGAYVACLMPDYRLPAFTEVFYSRDGDRYHITHQKNGQDLAKIDVETGQVFLSGETLSELLKFFEETKAFQNKKSGQLPAQTTKEEIEL